jgi:CheY-like chemotaxis protein
MSDNPIRILLIEDNPGDARLIKEMLNETKSAPFIQEWRDRCLRDCKNWLRAAPI